MCVCTCPCVSVCVSVCVCVLCACQQVWGTDAGSGPTGSMPEMRIQLWSSVSRERPPLAWGPGWSVEVMEAGLFLNITLSSCLSDRLSVSLTVQPPAHLGLRGSACLSCPTHFHYDCCLGSKHSTSHFISLFPPHSSLLRS